MPNDTRERNCPQCGPTRWIPSDPQICTFRFQETAEYEVRRLYCALCERCHTLFVPVDMAKDDGRPECGRFDSTFSDFIELEFTYPRLAERRRHTLVAMKLKCCGKFVVLGANPGQKGGAADLLRQLAHPASDRAGD